MAVFEIIGGGREGAPARSGLAPSRSYPQSRLHSTANTKIHSNANKTNTYMPPMDAHFTEPQIRKSKTEANMKGPKKILRSQLNKQHTEDIRLIDK